MIRCCWHEREVMGGVQLTMDQDGQIRSKIKAFPKKTAARTIDDLWNANAEAIELFNPTECENDLTATGGDRDDRKTLSRKVRIMLGGVSDMRML